MSVYDNLNIDKVKEVRLHIEHNSVTIDDIVNEIIQPYCRDLDEYVDFIRDCLKGGENPPTNAELEDWCMNLSTFIYFAGGLCEQLGVRDDISKAVYRETYNSARSNESKGTVADKDTIAELSSQQELLTNICYNRAYKTMKAKVENAQELLASVKKTLSHRMQEMELTRISNG